MFVEFLGLMGLKRQAFSELCMEEGSSKWFLVQKQVMLFAYDIKNSCSSTM